MHNLFPALIVDKSQHVWRPKQIAIVAGVSDNLFAIDVETGELIWKKHFESTWTPPRSAAPATRSAPVALPPRPSLSRPTRPASTRFWRSPGTARLHQINVADGEEVARPGEVHAAQRQAVCSQPLEERHLHATAQGAAVIRILRTLSICATGKVGSWGPAGGGMWGRTGPAIGPDGTMYTGTGDGRWDPEDGIFGNGIIGLKQNPDTKALELADYFAPTNAEWLDTHDLDMQVTPAIFPFKGKELMVMRARNAASI